MIEIYAQTTEFIVAQKRTSAKQTYSAAFELFRRFNPPQGTIRDFLARVEIDYNQRSFLDQKRVAINTMNDFVVWMKRDTALHWAPAHATKCPFPTSTSSGAECTQL